MAAGQVRGRCGAGAMPCGEGAAAGRPTHAVPAPGVSHSSCHTLSRGGCLIRDDFLLPLVTLSHTVLQGGCIIRAEFLDDIRKAYANDPALPNLLVDPFFAQKLADSQVGRCGSR